MKSNNEGISISVTGCITLALSAALCIGTATGLGACSMTEEGTWMTCHWAGQVEIWFGALLAVLSAIGMVFNRRAKIGLDAGISLTALLCAFVPGNIINLCMMADMHCRAIMKPYAMVMGILIAAFAAADIFVQKKKL